MRTRSLLTSAALSIGLLFGAAGVAGAQEAPPTPERGQEICARQDEIKARVAEREARFQQLRERLVNAQARATEAGRDELAAFLTDSLTRLDEFHTKVSERVTTRLEKLDQYCASMPGAEAGA